MGQNLTIATAWNNDQKVSGKKPVQTEIWSKTLKFGDASISMQIYCNFAVCSTIAENGEIMWQNRYTILNSK